MLNKRKILIFLLILLFALSRLITWYFGPVFFTEIIYSYMPYAHLWASGVKPYLEQWYEYPPATIPLFYLPHMIDMATLETWWHLNYAIAYRLQMLIIDTSLFALIMTVLIKRKLNNMLLVTPLIYYILATTKAHDFIYDTMDLSFAAAMTLGVAAPELLKGAKATFLTWLGYSLAVALKLMNGPLGLVYAIQERKNWKQLLLVGGLAGSLVWAVPLLLYRSSLSVMLVYHQIRGLQADSTGAIIVRIIDKFTHSEKVVELYKNYEMTGILSTEMLKILGIIFPVAIIIFIIYSSYIVYKAKPNKQQYLRISFTVGYVILTMIIGKVLSRPFMLWLIPLIAILPFENWKKQMRFLLVSLIAISVQLTLIPSFEIGIFDSGLLVGITRSLLFFLLFYWWWQQLRSKILE
ncbi:MAG: hypothetical protein COY80_04680 [Candidatus Pacebacteria bacterium CG_4_10_14_0_8_um_filter_42_14]|nr:MAG: hypothetical protein COY80_04680 [Candidatus Pacebacteria bacterium CG_4_10_14_0_8_um_filter_42_14]